MKKDVLKVFYDTFKPGQIITRDNVRVYLEKFYGPLKDATLAWRIYDLKQNHYIRYVGTNAYEVLNPNAYENFTINIDSDLMNTLKAFNTNITHVKRRFPDEENINISVWNTEILNQYALHIVHKPFYIVEIDADRMESLFHNLKTKYTNVFLSRKMHRLNDYLSRNGILIDRLPKRSPLKHKRSYKKRFISTPKIEKILVDIVVYNKDVLPYDHSELKIIYTNMFKKHVVDVEKVKNYARIRGINTKEKVLQLLDDIGGDHYD